MIMIGKVLRVLKKAAILALPILLIISLTACKEESQYSEPTEKFFVNDFADVMTESDADLICRQGIALQEKTTAQAVVVTIDSLDGKDAYEYALELGREWGVGDADEDNGIVILFSKGDREIYIAVGYGLEGALPDSKTGRIIDNYGMSYFKADDFSAGIASVYNSIVNEIYLEYDIEIAEGYTPVAELPYAEQEGASAGKVALSWLVLAVLVILYVLIFGRRGGLFIFGPPRFFGGGFGGFRGGSGGFGGFSGGGGSFGGGGAGRKF